MSRKISKSILSLDEINLLRYSEEPKNTQLYGNLLEAINTMEHCKAVELEELIALNDIARAALTYNKQSLIDSVKKEWYTEAVSEVDPKQKIRCGLCNTPNKYLFYIRNRFNNNRLNVGSFCMTKFPGIEGYMEHKQQLNQIQKNHKTIARRTEFHTAFPNVLEIIKSASEYFSTLPILLPEYIYYSLEEVVGRLSSIYNQYVTYGKKPFESIFGSLHLFQLAINQYNKLKPQADEFVKNNINNSLICRRKEIDWLMDNNKYRLMREISLNGGEYTISTASHIYSHDFVRDNFNKFSSKNTYLQLKIKFPHNKEDNNLEVYYSKTGYNPPVALKITFIDFMSKIGGECVFNEQFKCSDKNLLKISNIINSGVNLESIIAYTANMMNHLNYIFLQDDQTGYLYLLRKADKAIAKMDAHIFMKAYSKQLLENDDTISKYLLNIVSSIKDTSWVGKELQEKHDIYDKITRLYKEQYINSDMYEMKNSGSQIEYIEIPLYTSERISASKFKIDFNKLEYIKIPRSKLPLKFKNHRYIDYAIINVCENILYLKKGDLMLIQSNAKIRENDTIIMTEGETCFVNKYKNTSNSDVLIFNDEMKDINVNNNMHHLGKILGYIRS